MRLDPLAKMALGGQVDITVLTQAVRQITAQLNNLEDKIENCTKITCPDCDCKTEDSDGQDTVDRPKAGRRTRKDVSSS